VLFSNGLPSILVFSVSELGAVVFVDQMFGAFWAFVSLVAPRERASNLPVVVLPGVTLVIPVVS